MPGRLALALPALLLVAAIAPAGDPKDVKSDGKDEPTPFYASWSKFEPGTSTTLIFTTTVGKDSQVKTLTVTLVEKKDGVLVFESDLEVKLNGKVEQSGRFRKKLGKEDDKGGLGMTLPVDPKTGKPADTVEEGTEKVKVGDSEFDCRWYKVVENTPSGYVTESKVWMSDSFPGTWVKSVSRFGPAKGNELTVSPVAAIVKK